MNDHREKLVAQSWIMRTATLIGRLVDLGNNYGRQVVNLIFAYINEPDYALTEFFQNFIERLEEENHNRDL